VLVTVTFVRTPPPLDSIDTLLTEPPVLAADVAVDLQADLEATVLLLDLELAGIGTYIVVSSTLSDQQIAVSEDAEHFAGQTVSQPWQAYTEANTIAKHAEGIAGGKTYAELPQDDPNRQTVMIASFLQASLFTSVVAFGVAAMAAGLGVVLLLVGIALRSLSATVGGEQAAPVVAPAPTPA
jgi:hypothetical protein